MRLGWDVPLPGPFFLSGTIWRSKRRHHHGKVYHGTYHGHRCPHNHTRPDTAQHCAETWMPRHYS